MTWYRIIEPEADLPPWLREEIEALALSWSEGGTWSGPMDGDPCVWLDLGTRRCRHYEYRPGVCKDFDVGSPECLEWREGAL